MKNGIVKDVGGAAEASEGVLVALTNPISNCGHPISEKAVQTIPSVFSFCEVMLDVQTVVARI